MIEQALPAEAPLDCALCPRLKDFRDACKAREPGWFCAPAPSFGAETARLLIVGLAPGLRGANRTGRPFTGDQSGAMLFAALDAFGFSRGVYHSDPTDGLLLVDAMITNAVRCVPPGNKPTGAEIAACRPYLRARIDALPNLAILLCLGRVAHESTLRALGERLRAHPFAHGAAHALTRPRDGAALTLFDSYHCSRYNTQTGVLTTEMFHAVFADIRSRLDAADTRIDDKGA